MRVIEVLQKGTNINVNSPVINTNRVATMHPAQNDKQKSQCAILLKKSLPLIWMYSINPHFLANKTIKAAINAIMIVLYTNDSII